MIVTVSECPYVKLDCCFISVGEMNANINIKYYFQKCFFIQTMFQKYSSGLVFVDKWLLLEQSQMWE